MPTGYFEVDTGLLRQTSGEIRENYQLLEKTQQELIAEMEKLEKMWEGPAKNAFVSQFREYCALFEETLVQVGETLTCMDNAVTEYEACSNRVNGIVDAIKV